MSRFRLFAATTSAMSLAFLPACAQDTPAEPLTRDQVKEIVAEYIRENPEIVEEALITLTERERAREREAARSAIADNREALVGLSDDPAIGPDDAPVTVVEFFDYRCGFCKRSADFVAGLPAKNDGDVRVVFKEFPILSPESEAAARAALAAQRQGRYFDLHMAFMQTNAKLSDADIDRIAGDLGLDVDRLRADMASPEITQKIEETKALAREIGVTGTPAFVIGDELVAGADTQKVNALIEIGLSG